MSSSPVRRLAAVLIALFSLTLLTVGAAQAAPPRVDHHQELELRTETALNICGDLAVFDFNVKGSITVVEDASGEVLNFHATWVGNLYRPRFLDPLRSACGSPPFVRSSPPRPHPAGRSVFRFIANSHEGPVLIHETTTSSSARTAPSGWTATPSTSSAARSAATRRKRPAPPHHEGRVLGILAFRPRDRGTEPVSLDRKGGWHRHASRSATSDRHVELCKRPFRLQSHAQRFL